jgi:hypothetical protein
MLTFWNLITSGSNKKWRLTCRKRRVCSSITNRNLWLKCKEDLVRNLARNVPPPPQKKVPHTGRYSVRLLAPQSWRTGRWSWGEFLAPFVRVPRISKLAARWAEDTANSCELDKVSQPPVATSDIAGKTSSLHILLWPSFKLQGDGLYTPPIAFGDKAICRLSGRVHHVMLQFGGATTSSQRLK